MPTHISNSEEDTKKFAANLAKKITSGVIALSGELGAGKTTFVQGFAKGLGIKEKIISPTFVLIRQHKIPKTSKILYHIDLYRLEDNLHFQNLGLEEIISNPKNLILIEWAEKIAKNLPKNTLQIKLEKKNDTIRSITLS